MAIYGIGIDLIDIARIQRAVERRGERFLTRVYTEAERHYCRGKRPPYPCYAARFAAKEAFLKALGTGLRQHMRWRDIEVRHDALGKPQLRLSGYLDAHCQALGIRRIHLSLTHSATSAAAQVILER
ncbi:MAG: holo-[acyl-carrier-protein] synthase [Candidatus Tectimicrobiota bacterium]|nr:MAG: holo-[acyl-carrier-protein] synthase [Candidatus Tectomicrobia bacterium]